MGVAAGSINNGPAPLLRVYLSFSPRISAVFYLLAAPSLGGRHQIMWGSIVSIIIVNKVLFKHIANTTVTETYLGGKVQELACQDEKQRNRVSGEGDRLVVDLESHHGNRQCELNAVEGVKHVSSNVKAL
jgi:hypothetical protein